MHQKINNKLSHAQQTAANEKMIVTLIKQEMNRAGDETQIIQDIH